MVNIRLQNDIMTDDAALGPSQMGKTLKSQTKYTEAGLPAPPAGWNRDLGTNPISDRLAHTYTKTVSDASI